MQLKMLYHIHLTPFLTIQEALKVTGYLSKLRDAYTRKQYLFP